MTPHKPIKISQKEVTLIVYIADEILCRNLFHEVFVWFGD
jgi:hypothetical protein